MDAFMSERALLEEERERTNSRHYSTLLAKGRNVTPISLRKMLSGWVDSLLFVSFCALQLDG